MTSVELSVNRRRKLTPDRRSKLTPCSVVARNGVLAPAELVGVAQPGERGSVRGLIEDRSEPVLEAPALVAGLDDVAVVGDVKSRSNRDPFSRPITPTR